MIYLIRFFKGILLGCTAVIPGISIGTMALVLDVYTKIINSLTFFLSPKRWFDKKDFITSITFIIPVIIGIICAMVFFSSILLLLLKNNESFVRITFSGIILGTLPHVFVQYIRPNFFIPENKQSHAHKKYSWLFFIFFTIIGLSIILLLSNSDNSSHTKTSVSVNFIEILRAFVFGIISAAAGIIPGISGSYILLTLGYYSSFLYILSNFVITLVIPLLLGSAFGLVGVAFGIQFIIKKFPAAAYSVILGMILGSFIKITPWTFILKFTTQEYIIAIICLIAGSILSTLSEKLKPESET